MAEDNTWIVDSMIQFMQCPEWVVPVQQYIDTHCISFDAEDESPLEHTTIHNDFKKMCEGLLEGFLGEIGIPLELFVTICAAASRNPKCVNSIGATQIMEWLLAIDDFQSFKMLMEKRNIMLELEVMQELQQQPAPPSGPTQSEVDEEEELRLAIEASLREYENIQQKAKEMEDAELQQALKLSEDIAKIPPPPPSVVEKLEKMPPPPPPPVSSVVPTPEKQAPPPPPPVEAQPEPANPPARTLAAITSRQGPSVLGTNRGILPGISSKPLPPPPVAPAQPKVESAPEPISSAPKLTEEEIRQRAQYMKEQKEKLIRGRNQQREEELKAYTKEKSDNGNKVLSSEEIEQQKARLAVARRFHDDLLEETKKAALRGGN